MIVVAHDIVGVRVVRMALGQQWILNPMRSALVKVPDGAFLHVNQSGWGFLKFIEPGLSARWLKDLLQLKVMKSERGM
eukprot:3671379-Lingulodinium_polyedra.AAC.1